MCTQEEEKPKKFHQNKVKILTGYFYADLESEINKFMQNRHIRTVKLDTVHVPGSTGDVIRYTAIVIYTEEVN